MFNAIQLTVAWLYLPAHWAAVYTLALPYTGYYALLYRRRRGRAFQRARAFIHFWADPGNQDDLARRGREIIADIRALDQKSQESN